MIFRAANRGEGLSRGKETKIENQIKNKTKTRGKRHRPQGIRNESKGPYPPQIPEFPAFAHIFLLEVPPVATSRKNNE